MSNLLSQRHLFVVGFFRSGTSLLYNFLNLHPEIKLLFEANVFNHSVCSIPAQGRLWWWERLDFHNGCCQRHGLVAQLSWKNVLSTREAADILYHQYGGTETSYIGEKSPNYYNCLPMLARQFPDSKFIVLWRNPLDVISSIFFARQKDWFFCNRSLPLQSILGFEQMQTDVLALRKLGVPLFELCYENLVENPEVWLKSICAFLELPFDPSMLQLERADCSMFHSGDHHSKAKSGKIICVKWPPDPSLKSNERKIRGYLSRWKLHFRDKLATQRYWSDAAGSVPRITLICDRIEYTWINFCLMQLTPLEHFK